MSLEMLDLRKSTIHLKKLMISGNIVLDSWIRKTENLSISRKSLNIDLGSTHNKGEKYECSDDISRVLKLTSFY